MRQITTKLYSFDELSESAKQNVLDNYLYDIVDEQMESINYDYVKALDKIASVTNYKAVRYEVGLCTNTHFRIEHNTDYDSIFDYFGEYEIKGELLFRYLNRSMMPYIRQRKNYYKWNEGNIKKRTSRIVFGDSEITGDYCDFSFMKELLEYYNNWYKYPDVTLEDLMEKCYSAFFGQWEEEFEEAEKDENIEDFVLSREWEFKEDGTKYSA